MFVRVFVKQENIVSHHDAMPEDEEHVMPGGILVTTKFQKSLQRSLRAKLVSFSVDGFSARRGFRRIVAFNQFTDRLFNELAVASPLAIPKLVINEIHNEGIIVIKLSLGLDLRIDFVDHIHVKNVCRRTLGERVELHYDVGLLMEAGGFNRFEL